MAMENGPLISYFLIKTSIDRGFSIAMFDDQRVNRIYYEPTYHITTQFTPRFRDTQPGSRYRWLSCERLPNNTPAQTSHAFAHGKL